MTKRILLIIAAVSVMAMAYTTAKPIIKVRTVQVGTYKEKRVLNMDPKKFITGKNLVQGVVLHHTACASIEQVLGILAGPGGGKSCHVIIDRDGTRYVLADPERITRHAGYSYLNGREKASEFTIGIEFHSTDTRIQPLTEAQIESAIDYLLPIIKKYKIKLANIATHEQVRAAWLKRHPGRTDVPTTADISQADYKRFMAALRKRLSR